MPLQIHFTERVLKIPPTNSVRLPLDQFPLLPMTMHKEAVHKETVLKETLLKETLLKETLLKEAVLKETVLKETVLKETILKETMLKEVPLIEAMRLRDKLIDHNLGTEQQVQVKLQEPLLRVAADADPDRAHRKQTAY
jgi:hypothetical protein